MDAWIPYVVPPAERVRGDHYSAYLEVIGRLKPGVSVNAARARMEGIRTDLARRFPGWFRNGTMSVRPLRETIVGADVQSWMLMLMAAVAFVLLIACVNVASLMLARASSRTREMGVRAALGASRWQLVRAVLVESLLLSAAGTVSGVLCAYGAVDAIRASLPANLPRSAAIGVNWRVLLAAAAAAVITGLVCGILPAIQGSRPNLTRALREGGRSGTSTLGRQRLRAILVGGEVGLAIILLVGAGLFISSFVRLTSIELGLDYRRVLTVGLTPRGRGPQTPAQRAATSARVSSLVGDVLPVIRQIAGVQSVAALSGTRPLEGGHDRTNVIVRGHEQDFMSADDQVDVYRITSDYPAVIGVPLVRGRLLRADENAAGAPVALLNDVAAARYFPGVDPIGQTIGIAGDRTIVGILHSVRAGGPETELRPEAYLPFSHDDAPFAYLVIKTTGDPAAAVTAVKGAIWSVAPGLPLSDVQTLEDFLGRLIAPRKFNMLLIGLFGTLALAIASVGIYGVMAYVVEQRTAEIGLRMALGARPGEVVGMILRRALLMLGGGLAAGLLVAWPLAQTLRTFLFHVQPHEVVVYAAASVVLLGAGLVAAFGPARRASRVDPVIALRAE
jgi:predicted permease